MRKIYLFAILTFTAFVSGCIRESDGVPDPLPLPSLEFSDLSVIEGDIDEVLKIKVTLTGTNNANAVVKFAGLSGTAEAPVDYEVLSPGQLVFAPGETQKDIEVRLIGDEVREIKETFQLKFYSPVNVILAKDILTVSVEDDDNNTAGLVIPTGGFSTPLSYPGYNLVWADEFEGTSLNTANWTYEMGAGGWGNNELQYYREDNCSIVDGNLVITAKKQKFGSSDYTSSRIITKGKKSFKFGRIDVRAALPEGKGIWPAIWMLGSNIDVVSWPACGEIDIMELTGDLPNRVLGTVHYGANTSQHQYITQSKYLSGNANFQDEFHVFSINWEADKIDFLVDDQIYHSITPANLNGAAYPFNKPFFFVMNVAVGGTLPGSPNNTTPFPQSMIVDYIRVFQK